MAPRRPLALFAFAIVGSFSFFLLFGPDLRTRPDEPHFHDLPNASSRGSFRDRLAHVRPLDRLPHSRTLGVDEIVVISLPQRADRRDRMSLLARALDADFSFFDGTPSASAEVAAVLEYARVQREREGVVLAPSSPAGRLAPDERPPQEAPEYPFTRAAFAKDADVREPAGADLWTLPAGDPRAPRPALPPAPTPDTRPRIHQIMGTLEHTRQFMDDPGLGFEDISQSVIACWHAHYSLVRSFAIADGPLNATMLIMEDDVDMEFDFETTLRRSMPGLPADWDVLLPGYCDSTETNHRPVAGYPRLRRSHHPLCNHGYIVSRRGARRLVSLLRSPSFAYSRPLDQAYQYLINEGLLNFYSITPVQIVQEHKLGSDIRPGTGSGWWDDDLADSALQRAQLLLDQE